MPRTRSLKHGLYQNDVLAELPIEARYLFPGLSTIADRAGRLEDRPKKIKGQLYPFDEVDVDALLAMLADKEFITRYEINGKRYIQINTFSKHQNPHPHEPKSVIPVPLDVITSNDKDGVPADSVRNAVVGNKKDKGLVLEGEGSGEGDKMPSWMADFYSTFRDVWNGFYAGQDYDDVRKPADFVFLAKLQNNKALTPENWSVACQNYLASPRSSHTLADLANHYSTFFNSALDRFNKPVTANSSGKETASDRNVRNLRDGLAILRTPRDHRPNNPEVPARLLSSGTKPRGG